MEVTEALVRQVAELARLELSDEEVRAMVGPMGRILAHVASVQEVDVAGIDPATQEPVPLDRLRPDEPTPPLALKAVLANAPKHDGACLVVPKFVEE
jgi:aspartyl-tRNA(Asn)/glutamyl-tRNA(Gln) amidotransferase subunit C